MDMIWQDLRYSVRMLTKSPGFALIALATLALSTGANTAIFSVVNAEFLRPLPYPDADRLVTVANSYPALRQATFSPGDFVDLRAQQQSFDELFAYRSAILNLTGGGNPTRVQGVAATSGFFDVLRIRPAIGGTSMFESWLPERDKVVIISNTVWQTSFGGDQNIIGRILKLDGESFNVIGVMPANFKFIQPADIVIPFVADASRSNAFLRVVARLHNGIDVAQADAETTLNAERVSAASAQPGSQRQATVVIPLRELTKSHNRLGWLLLFAATGCVLLIACANLANLLLTRAAGRQKEMAIRAAVGASRWRLIRQMLTESFVLSLIGGACGILLAIWGIDALLSLTPSTLPSVNSVTIDFRVLGFTSGVTLFTGILFGLAPALQGANVDLNRALKDGFSIQSGGFSRFSFRQALIVGELAVALTLLVGAGLLLNSLVRLLNVDPGFAPERALAVNLRLPGGDRFRTTAQVVSFHQKSVEHLREIPGVQAVGIINKLPLDASQLRSELLIEGQTVPEGLSVDVPTIGGDYFSAMGIPMLRGRTFAERDTENSPGVAIISEGLANSFFADGNAIGRRLAIDKTDDNQPDWREIIAVVGDVRQQALASNSQPTVYVPNTQTGRGLRDPYFVVRTTGEPSKALADVQREIQTVDPDMPIISTRTIDEVVGKSVSEQRFNAEVLGLFAVLALNLSAVGLYGVMSYFVAQRTKEIGIRLALGAQPDAVMRLILGQGIKLALIGVAIGLVASTLLTRIMQNILFGVSATDPMTFLGIAFLLTAVALLACFIPASRASGVDPMIALRCE